MTECDGCTFCCTILGVIELKKPANTDCRYCTGERCGIHNDPLIFPRSCADFDCGYRISNLPIQFRPDHCHIMITGEEEPLQCHFLHVDPKYPNAPETPIGRELIRAILAGGKYPNILITTGTHERIISRDPRAARKLAKKLKKMRRATK